MKTFFIAIRAIFYMTCFFALWGWLALEVRSFDGRLGLALPGWTTLPGSALMISGCVLALWCVGEFVRRGRGTPAPFDAPRQIVSEGPYRYVRNPMYVGGAALLGGFGLYAHSVSILLLAGVLLLIAHLFVVLYEEPTLRSSFGSAYEAYCREVHRWLPKRSKSDSQHGTQAV